VYAGDVRCHHGAPTMRRQTCYPGAIDGFNLPRACQGGEGKRGKEKGGEEKLSGHRMLWVAVCALIFQRPLAFKRRKATAFLPALGIVGGEKGGKGGGEKGWKKVATARVGLRFLRVTCTRSDVSVSTWSTTC